MTSPQDLVSLVSRAFEQHRARPLFALERHGRWIRLTYGEIERDATRLRAGLARLGVKAGDRVAIISKNRPEWLVVMAATHALGAALVPMYEVQLESDWKHILRDAEARVCVTSTDAIAAKVRAMLGDLPRLAHVVSLERSAKDDASYAHLLETAGPAPSPIAPSPRDLAAIIYTSGTTGKPKGVELSHQAYAWQIATVTKLYGIEPGARNVAILPWAHVAGFCEVLVSLDRGTCMGLVPSVEKLGETLQQTKPTLLIGVPRVWSGLYDAVQKAMAEQPPAVRWIFRTGLAAQSKRRQGKRLRKRERVARRLARRLLFPKILGRLGGELRIGVTGAAAIAPAVQDFFECLGIQMFDVYGQTETCAVATANRPGKTRAGSVGAAIDGVRIEIDTSVGDGPGGSGGADRGPLGVGEGVGEILIHTEGAMRGYHKMPGETSAVMREPGVIRTGDLGRLDRDGFLYLTGRVREVYKLENGKFVSPVPIEEALALSPYVAQAFVWGLNKPHNVALLVADLVALKRWCGENGVGESEPERLLAHARVRELFARELRERTTAFKGYERVEAFALIHEAFTPDNGLLTPTLKTKRTAVYARHRAVIDALY
jgi:long-chain acyl-CoA synthetase